MKIGNELDDGFRRTRFDVLFHEIVNGSRLSIDENRAFGFALPLRLMK